MPLTSDVIEHGKVVLQYWSGQVTGDEVVAHEQHHLADPRIEPGASVLIDAREAHCEIRVEDIRAIVNGLYAVSRRPLTSRRVHSSFTLTITPW